MLEKSKELREVSKALYWYVYLDAKEMKEIYEGKTLEKEKVRDWQAEQEGGRQHGLITFDKNV